MFLMELEDKVKCVRQAFKSNNDVYIPPWMIKEGVGNCPECETDGNNGHCKAYTKAMGFYFKVKEKEKI